MDVMRAVDVVLALALVALLGPALWLLRRYTRIQRQQGQGGRPFERRVLLLPSGRRMAWLRRLGLAHAWLPLHVLRGDMAWVGPRARALDESVPAQCLSVRPGVINPWFLRRRTAVDYGSESEADLQYLEHRGLVADLGLLLRGTVMGLLMQPATGSTPERVVVGDVEFDNLSMPQALSRLVEMLDGGRTQQVCFVNPACVNIAARHRGYRRVLARASLVLPDGIGIRIGAGLLGTPLKQNVNGTDLFPRLCERLEARGSSIFLLGGQPGIADAVAAEVRRRWPGLRIAGVRHGFFELAQEGDVVADIRSSRADVLFVARGVPEQDLFIDRHLPFLGVKTALGVGGLFDFVSGRIARAPSWMRETGLEWTWRLAQEPGRMWKRYLIGNASFLLRMVLQRLALRQPAADRCPTPAGDRSAQSSAGVRTVVFATQTADGSLPVAQGHPVALLPLGCTTAAEQLMANLARARIGDVDLVVCDQPESLRAVLGDGSRWGLRLHWHLVKDGVHPYGVLDAPALRSTGRLLIGHAGHCLAPDLIAALSREDGRVLGGDAMKGLSWTGWASVSTSDLGARAADLDREGLASTLDGCEGALHLCSGNDGADGSERLLQAQPFDRESVYPGAIPGSWISMPWGAMSPDARVDAGAELTGPVLIGPGCVVQREARLGPQVVLSRDVVVGARSFLARAVVLPGSYIGGALTLTDCIVNGDRVRHLRHGVETRHVPQDGLLLSLTPASRRSPHWGGRLGALMALVLVGPWLLGHVVSRRLCGRSADWSTRRVVVGVDAHDGSLRVETLRCGEPMAAASARRRAGAAALLDVAAGRRAWFGMRPRSLGHWYALRTEWQQVLGSQQVGLLHAPAWSDGEVLGSEAGAVADVYAAVQSSGGRMRLALSSLMALIGGTVVGAP